MSENQQWADVRQARSEWHRTDEVLNNLRDVHAHLAALHGTLSRNKPDEEGRQDAIAAVERLETVEGEQLSFLSEPVLSEDKTVTSALRSGSPITTEADTVATALTDYGAGGSWSAVDDAFSVVLREPDRSMGIDTVVLGEITELFELAVEAGVRYRKRQESVLQDALADAYADVAEPLGSLDEQPVALLPVRLETRFVDESGQTDGPREELLVRVYPDQIHTDSHEAELTEKEIAWGQNFWATLWYARHPDPTTIGDNPNSEYLDARLPNQRLRERVAGIDSERFSDDYRDRYDELKERAWQQLLERFDRERASYIVHALKPTEDDVGELLLEPPRRRGVRSDGGEDSEEDEELAESEFQVSDERFQTGGGNEYEIADDEYDVVDDAQGGAQVDNVDATTGGDGDGHYDPSEYGVEIDEEDVRTDIPHTEMPDVPIVVPPLTFPSVPRRPQQWTKQARAKLLPDRWIAVAEWEDHTGEPQRTAVVGDPIREPLAVGPSAESIAEDSLDAEDEGGAAPDGTGWMTDFQDALDAGMGLRLPLRGLAGFDPERGFDRVSVIGVRGSVDPQDGTDELVDLLDAHHYTDGLSFLPQGTPTNNHDHSAGVDDETEEGLAAAVSPPLVENGDRSDGDLLARALAIDPDEGEEHIFANVANADNTEQRDARHANSALWPATIGYTMEQLYVDNDVVGNPVLDGTEDLIEAWRVDQPDREDLETEMLWLDAYRRHFIRYVRARGPFPTLRVGSQPYGVLPASPIETDRDLSLIDPQLIADLGAGRLDAGQLEAMDTSVRELAAGGAEPTKLVEAGADPDELVDAGVDPRRLVSGGVDPEEAFDATGLVPDSLLQDGVGVQATSQVTTARLEAEGVESEAMEEAGVTPRALARGEVTDEQLEEAGVTTEQIAAVILPEKAQALGLTPAALERANISPSTLLDGEFSDQQVQQLGLTTRGIADAMLPTELRDLGVTPKTIKEADISPRELLNGEVSPEQLQAAGIDTETVAEALIPDEAIEYGVSPEAIAAADISVADLFNGDVSLDQLEAAGFDVQTLQNALLPDAFRKAGITIGNLLDAGITPDAVMNGQVTPDNLVAAGLTPTTLAEAGVLPEAVSAVSEVVTDLLDAGLDPVTLVERGLTPEALVEAGITPEMLIDAGLAPKKLVDAGFDAVELAASGAASGDRLLEAGVSPAKLARAGLTVADLAGGDVPVKEMVSTGATALELASQGADAVDLAAEGARPSNLRGANVDAGTLREAGQAAGSLRTAGYGAEELLDSGYTVEELLNGGFAVEELSAAGVDPAEIEHRRRDVSTMLASGHQPAELRQAGFAPDQLLDGGLNPESLTEAGYTAGELVDAGLTTELILDAGFDVVDLRAADVDVAALLRAGVDLATLRESGATAEELLRAGHEPAELLAAGFDRVELEVAGVDVDALFDEASEEDLVPEDTSDPVVENLQYAATVMEDPEQAERDTYRFSFDPAIPREAAPETPDAEATGNEPDESSADGGIQTGGVPVVRPLSVDDRLDGRLKRELRGFGSTWHEQIEEMPFGHNLTADGLTEALERSALSTDISQRTMLYSGEFLKDAKSVKAGAVCKSLLRPRTKALRKALADAGLDGRHPRISYFASLSPRYSNLRVTGRHAESQVSRVNLDTLYEAYDGTPKKESVDQYDLVDSDIDRFIDVLLGSSVKEVHTLGEVFRGELGTEFDAKHIYADEGLPTDFDVDQEAWDSFDISQKRNRLVRAIEAASSPKWQTERITGNSLDEFPKLDQMARNAQEYGDSGALKSLLRILLQYGYVQEYLTARRRLGLAFDEMPTPWFEPAYAQTDDSTPLQTLNNDVAEPITYHPNLNYGDDLRYWEALEDAAANYSSTSSIDPRISEFTDSLQYLAEVDPEDLSTLVRETLDLASHRMDAWWTSVATKELLELREAQGTVTDGEVDHESWDGAGSDVPRATVDPALVGNVDTEEGEQVSDHVDSQVPEGVESAAETENVGYTTESDGRAFDPAALTGDEIGDTDEFVAGDPTADGGIDPTRSGPTGEANPEPADEAATEQGGEQSEDGAFDIDTALLEAGTATRVDDVDPTRIDDRSKSDPGLYVGGYGFVENLSADRSESDGPEYIHAPSEQHATTAAILKSGSDAHDADEGENVLALDLSAERVRAGLRLIRGVRRGQGLPELLGYRFERRIHEVTLDPDEPNLMQYADVFREKYPRKVGDVEKPDSNDLQEERLKELAARDTVDGLALFEDWDDYPFGRADDLPPAGSDAHEEFSRIISNIGEDIDAAGDMLIAESVHQIGQGNYDRAGGSLDALAKGAQLPDPDVIETPRSGTGVTHRHCVLLGESEPPVGTPRGEAAPSLATWVDTMLPDLSGVECTGTYHWEEETEEEEMVEEESSTTITLDVLDLGPLDVLLLFGADQQETRSELEQRLAYHLIRERPDDVPADATVELEFTVAAEGVSAGELLEVARSVRELVQSTRPATAADLAHPGDFDGEGYTPETAKALRTRANQAQDTLYQTAADIDERLALFDAEHMEGDGIDGLSTPDGATSDGGTPADSSWDNLDGSVLLPQDNSPVLDEIPTLVLEPLPEQVDGLVAAVDAVDEEVPLTTAETVADDIDPATVRSELSTLLAELPAGSANPDAARADQRVEAAQTQRIAGTIGGPVDVPNLDPDTDSAEDSDEDGEETGDDDGDPSAGGPIAWGEVDPATEDVMGVSEASFETVEMYELSEVEYEEPAYTVDPTLSDPTIVDPDADTDDASEGEDEEPGVDWSDSTLTVRVWGTDGTSWFDREKDVSPDRDGRFSATFDFSAVEPGTSFQVAGIVDNEVVYSATGRVISDDDVMADAQDTFRSACDTLQRLLWLRDRDDLLAAGPSTDLVDAHENVRDWQGIREEAQAVDPATSTISQAEIDAITTLADMETFDPAALPDAVTETTEPVERLGLDRIVSLTGGEGGPDDLTYWVGANRSLTGIRARIANTLADPSLFNDGAPGSLLKYDHDTAAILHDMDDGEVVSAYLDAFLAQPAWTMRYLNEELDAEAAATVRNLTAWLYDPDSLDQRVDLSTQLQDLATAARTLPASGALFEGLPRGDASTRHEAFADHLDDVAEKVATSAPAVGGNNPETAFDNSTSAAVSDLRSAVTTERTTVEDVTSRPAADDAFRKAALEQLRETMTGAASYGVYGGTPTEPDGGSVEVTDRLLEQARALLKRLRNRIEESTPLDPRIHSALDTQPLAQRVETQTDRLERLFGDGFTVLPPFSPTNRDELSSTFTDENLIPDDQSLAAETWLQRSAAHRDRMDKFRETRSYADAFSETLAPSLTVGQVPYREGDTWTGVEGVEPEAGRISLVAEFGPGASTDVVADQMAGLSIDEWTETVPAAEETTGIALNYDDPGNRAPQSILLVPPPSSGPPTLDHLASTVAETADYAKRRSLHLGDFGRGREAFDPPFGLFPALNFVNRPASRFPGGENGLKGTPTVDFRMLDWYDKRIPMQLMPQMTVTLGGESNDS